MRNLTLAWGSVALFALLLLVPSTVAGVATVAIDFGSEWVKMAIVKPGTPMDIVLNRESKRKTPNVVAIHRGERTFGNDALNTAVKYPKHAYRYLVELLGQKLDSPVVKRYQAMFPEHTLEPATGRDGILFRIDEETTYSVEELVAMILEHANELAQEYAEQPISSHVIVVPTYFAQAERRAMLNAANLAGLNVLRLMSSSVAVGLNYGVFRRKEFNATTQNILFYDMGSTSTIATVAAYSIVKDKESKSKVPQMVVKGVGYDRTLGGFEWDHRLREQLLGIFQEQVKGKVKGNPAQDPRALAKLLGAAQRTKTVLSANTDTLTQVEGLFEEINFKSPITREALEDMATDLYLRVEGPIKEALAAANMTMANISHFIVVGGGVRMPKVQSILMEINGGRDLGKNLNGDEAFAMGAAYEAAALSKAFRVKKFIAKDANLFPIEITTEKTVEEEDGAVHSKTISATVFGRNAHVPLRKTLKLNVTEDFEFRVSYASFGFQADPTSSALSGQLLATHKVGGVKNAFAKHPNATAMGVKVRFELDLSGILNVSRIEVQFEAPAEETGEKKSGDSMLKKLGDSMGLGSLFGSESTAGGAEADGDADSDEGEDEPVVAPDASGSEENPQEDTPRKEDTDAATGEADTSGDEADATASEEPPVAPEATRGDRAGANGTAANGTTAEATNSTGNSTKKATAPQERSVRILLQSEAVSAVTVDLTGEEFLHAQRRLDALKVTELRQRRTAAALNSLEAFAFDTQRRMEEEEYQSVTTESEREAVAENLAALSLWLEDVGWEAELEVLEAKMQEAIGTLKDIVYRVGELRTRPQAIADLNQTLNMTQHFLTHMRMAEANRSEDMPEWYPSKAIDELEALFNETKTWLAEKVEAQSQAPLTESPVLKTSTLSNKNKKLTRELMYLVNKPPPKRVTKPKSERKAGPAANGTKESVNGTVDDTPEAVDEPPLEAPEPADELPTESTEAPTAEDTDATSHDADEL